MRALTVLATAVLPLALASECTSDSGPKCKVDADCELAAYCNQTLKVCFERSGADGGQSADPDAGLSAPQNTPSVPLPKSVADELPGKSDTLVTNVAPLINFNPYVDSAVTLSVVDSAAPATICPSFPGGNTLLISNGSNVQPKFTAAYQCKPYNCNCFFRDCDTCWNTCTAICLAPFIANSPCLRRTVYWKKLFQTTIGPGQAYSQAWTVETGSSDAEAEAPATAIGVTVKANSNLFSLVSGDISSTFRRVDAHASAITIHEAQAITQTFSCPASANNASQLFAVWQLHEVFDFADSAGKGAWNDPVYRPTTESALSALDNALHVYYESTTAF